MPQRLDYESPSDRRSTLLRTRRRLIIAFVAPPAVFCLAALLMRVALHFSQWEAVPVFAFVFVLCVGACLLLAGRYAAACERGINRDFRFFGWVACSAACAAAGLAIIGFLPLSVGDGP